MAEIRAIAVIGAGRLGRGIAHAAALGGFQTILEDVLPTTLARAGDEIRSLLDRGSLAGSVSEAEAQAAFSRIRFANTVESAARDADVIIEAVPDEIESKLEILTLLDRVSKPNATLITSTSFVMVTETASITFRPEHCVGMHFVSPVHAMRWVEIIPGQLTGKDAVSVAREVARRLKMEPVVVREVPGLIAGRSRLALLNEAFRMLGEGVATAEEINDALRLEFRSETGPFSLADQIGLDRELHSLEYLHRALGESYRPAPLLRELVRAGRLGRKTGRGVFEYLPIAGEPTAAGR